ncbi:MAG: phosphotransferase family protein [Pseudomonadota bacterium]
MSEPSEKQRRYSGTKPVADALAFDVERLREYLRPHLPDVADGLDVAQFKGGQSNPTYKLTTPSASYVLRRKPPGKLLKSAHAVDREYRILSTLGEHGLPVPPTIVLCDDDSVVGTMFYVMGFVDGRVFWEPHLPSVSPEERAAIYDSMNETLARLHNFDYAAAGLDDFGKPGNYFARQISRWSQQYRASETQNIVAMDKLIEWLPENIPDDDSASVVHGDYRLDNLIIAKDAPKVAAVLDWELSTIGHPLGDLTYHLMAWQIADVGIGASGLVGMDLAELGIPDEQSYIERYCERTGRRTGIDQREFYAAYNFFRIAAISQGIAGRVRDGTAASAHAARAEQAVAPLAAMAWRYAEQAGAR